jgi:uncharacterized PurR-regulated membrane protein YhhQ (DUF165 family)
MTERQRLHPIEASHLHARRERVFLVLAAIFLGSMTMLNILGVARFIDMSFEIAGIRVPFIVAVGVLPYPITFLCTDFISELYGRRRASFVVWVGLLLNDSFAFYRVRQLAMGAVTASMIAYLAAQFCDVFLFHFWKRLTRGRHLWLRFAVIAITHFQAGGIPLDPGAPIWPQLWVFIASAYVFKLAVAALDTVPFYLGVGALSRYLEIDPRQEHHADEEEVDLGGGGSA